MAEETNSVVDKTQEEQINHLLSKIDNKDFSFYFFTLDTLGNPVASVANIYEHVKVLNELGYRAYIMHEKDNYKVRGDENGMGINDWLGEEYASLPHISIEGQQLSVTPTDYIIIPEIFANVMDQVKQFPCKKIVFSQSYDYLLELLPIGKKWHYDYGFTDVITTSERQANYIKLLFQGINTHIVPVGIADYFKPSEKPKTPIVTIVTRNHGDAKKIANSFYLQFPVYKFITFKELRGMPKKQFAEELGKSCLAVWIDDQSGFGTFPLEAMQSGTPVIGKIPNMVPEWMESSTDNGDITLKNNGVWTNTTLNIPELIGTYMKVWFEDSVPKDLLDGMNETNGTYSTEKQKAAIEKVYGTLVSNRRNEFVGMINPKETNAEIKA
jgi:hypothetical protein